MSVEIPERIWLDNLREDGGFTIVAGGDAPFLNRESPEYVRADLVVALRAELAAAREALTEIDALDPEHLIDSCAQTAMRGLILRMGEIARAALGDRP